MKKMKEPIFIVGLPRSGSTLWSNILACDATIMRFSEMHFLNPWHKDFRYFVKKYAVDLNDDANVSRMVDCLFSGEKYVGLRQEFWEQLREIEPEKLRYIIEGQIMQSDRSLGSIFRILVAEATRIRGYDRAQVKFPVSVNYLNKLIEWFPDAKIVHITRDPRATALSKMNYPGGAQARLRKFPWARPFIVFVMKLFVVAEYFWSSLVHSQCREYKNYKLYKYEDLLLDPEAVVRDLCDFVSIEYGANMLAPRKGQPSSVTGKRRDGFDPAAAFRWIDKMPAFDRKMIGLLTRGSMARLGYDPEDYQAFRNEKVFIRQINR